MTKMMDAIYVIMRGDTNWTLLYLGSDYRKIHVVEDWAEIHCAKLRRVRVLSSGVCMMNNKFFHQN